MTPKPCHAHAHRRPISLISQPSSASPSLTHRIFCNCRSMHDARARNSTQVTQRSTPTTARKEKKSHAPFFKAEHRPPRTHARKREAHGGRGDWRGMRGLQRVLLAFNRPPQGGTSSVVDICGGLPGFFPSKQRSAGHTQPTYQPGTGTGTGRLTLSALRVVPPDARASIHPSYIVNVARVHSFTHIFCSLYPPQDQQQSKKRRGNSVPPRRSLLAPFPCPGGDRYVVSSESPERV